MTTCPRQLIKSSPHPALLHIFYVFYVSCRICGFVIRSATLVYLIGKVNLNESGITLFKSNKKNYDLRLQGNHAPEQSSIRKCIATAVECFRGDWHQSWPLHYL